ncbi:MAG: TOBE domain-containing protein, partial [Candidatus Limnocylindria bacterium]
FVADFVGDGNFVEGTLASQSSDGGTMVTLSDGSVLACRRLAPSRRPGERVIILVRPEDVLLSRQAPDGEPNVVAGDVELVVFQGSFVDLLTRTKCGPLRVRTHASGAIRIGDRVFLRIPPEACTLLGAESEP